MATHVPGLKRLPVFKLVTLAQLALLAREHVQRLQPVERRRLAELARGGRGLSASEREELRGLVAKVDPQGFARLSAAQLSPIPLPKRLTGGERRGS
jgi:hypothetical protein